MADVDIRNVDIDVDEITFDSSEKEYLATEWLGAGYLDEMIVGYLEDNSDGYLADCIKEKLSEVCGIEKAYEVLAASFSLTPAQVKMALHFVDKLVNSGEK